MSARSLNKAILIGNLTRDPELRYTPAGNAVCSFGVATNRGWTTDSGEKKEEVEFHRIVAWNKLAELCSQLLTKGRKVYLEGRLQTRNWQGQDGQQRTSTEIVIEDMIILDSRRMEDGGNRNPDAAFTGSIPAKAPSSKPVTAPPAAPAPAAPETPKPTEIKESPKVNEDINPDDIPF